MFKFEYKLDRFQMYRGNLAHFFPSNVEQKKKNSKIFQILICVLCCCKNGSSSVNVTQSSGFELCIAIYTALKSALFSPFSSPSFSFSSINLWITNHVI